MRLNRWLARAGVASRRKAEDLIRAGRVTVNGQVVLNPAVRCRPGIDRVELDGKPVLLPDRVVVIALNKPPGYTTTRRDPHARRTVMDLLEGVPVSVHPIGRLDRDSRGLLLFTNDGDLTIGLTHPRYEVPKVYRVLVRGHPSPEALQQLREGVVLSDGVTAPAQVKISARRAGGTELEITIKEGRKRQVRRMLAAVGHRVLDLQRIAVGPIRLGRLKEGQWRILSEDEIESLRAITVEQVLDTQGGDPGRKS